MKSLTTVLDDSEQIIQEELQKLQKFQDALQKIISAMQDIRKMNLDHRYSGTPEEMIKQLLEEQFCKKPVIDDIPYTKENITENKAVEINHVNKTVQPEPKQSQEKVITNNSSSENVQENEMKLITHLMVTAGPKVGVKYKIEVTSPLGVDGTFWACHVEGGYIQNKLEPLSERLRVATQNDRSTWVVDDFKKLVCVKSSDNGLWMRAKIFKQNNEHSVRVRFVDVGGIEDCPKSRLSKVPENLASIPYIAFNCTLAEDKISLDYETKWKFSDLTKKKVLNFTVHKIIQRGEESLAYGKLETILDNPPVDVNEAIVPSGISKQTKDTNGTAATSSSSAITSRDIRVQNPANPSEDFTSVSEIIRNNSISSTEVVQQNPSNNIEHPTESKRSKLKEQAHELPPLTIPEPSSGTEDSDWGESITPGAEEHVALSPLDENIFDSPTNSMGETQLREQLQLARKPSSSDLKQTPTIPNIDIATQQAVIDDIKVIEENLQRLRHHEEILSQSVASPERNQLLQAVCQNFGYFQQLLVDRQMSLQAYGQSALLRQPFFQARNNIPQALSIGNIPMQQAPIGTRPQQQLPIGHRPQHHQPLIQQSGLFNEAGGDSNDYLVKMQQLDAISRCLKTPSGMLDNEQIKKLQLAKDFLVKQLQEEELRKGQMEAIIKMQEKSKPEVVQTPPVVSNEVMRPNQFEQLQHLMQLRENLLVQNNTQSTEGQVYEAELTQGNQQRQTTTNTATSEHLTLQGKRVIDKVYTPPSQRIKEEEKSNAHNTGTIEITHTSKIDTTPKFKNFKIPSYETLMTEVLDDWITRELLNLEHAYLTHPKARFFSIVSAEVRPGKFMPPLVQTYQKGCFWLLESDARPFRKEWKRVDGPIFLLIKHKPNRVSDQWKVGGLCQVVSNVQKIENLPVNAKYYHQCKVNIISTAVIDDVDLRSDPVSREIPQDLVKKFIHRLVIELQEVTCMSMFQYQDKIIEQHQQDQHNSSSLYHFPAETSNAFYADHRDTRNTSSIPVPKQQMQQILHHSPEEDWDSELQSPQKKTPNASDDFGSGDECERDLNAEIEAFGLHDFS